MKKFLLPLSLIFLVACGETPSDPKPHDFTDTTVLEVDTISANNIDTTAVIIGSDTLNICKFIPDSIMGTVVRPPVSDEEIQSARPGGKKPRPTKPTDPTTPTDPTGPTGSGLATILLDFDGHNIPNGTPWNGGRSFTVANSGMTATEMQASYTRQYNTYTPLGFFVTTNEADFTAAPTAKRMRLIYTTTSDFYGNGAGGVAYTGSFKWGDNTPCFVFTALLNYNTKYITDAGEHEVGHTLGLPHAAKVAIDSTTQSCTVESEYDYGGDGIANKMGVGYYQAVSIFGTRVATPWCTFIDQLATIKGNL